MNDRGLRVLEQYDMEFGKMQRARGAMLIESNQGLCRLLEYHGSEKRLAYQEELLNALAEHGFGLVDCPIRSKEGSLSVMDHFGVRYILTKYYAGSECDVRNRQDLVEAVRTLAKLHNVLEMSKIKDGVYIPEAEDMQQEFSRHNLELKRIRNFIRKKKKKSEFEYQILQKFDEFYEIAEQTVSKLEESAYVERKKEASEKGLVCHGNYNYHNLLKTPNGFAVINFEHSRTGLALEDLYFFMRKVMEKQDWNETLAAQLLENYCEVRRLSSDEWKILGIFLEYPEKYWKILNHYYNGNKAYLPDQMKDKINKVYIQQEKKNMLLKTFFSKI